MKKILNYSIIIVFALILFSCGGGSTKKTESTEKKETQTS
jgi:hypothetical protein